MLKDNIFSKLSLNTGEMWYQSLYGNSLTDRNVCFKTFEYLKYEITKQTLEI